VDNSKIHHDLLDAMGALKFQGNMATHLKYLPFRLREKNHEDRFHSQ